MKDRIVFEKQKESRIRNMEKEKIKSKLRLEMDK